VALEAGGAGSRGRSEGDLLEMISSSSSSYLFQVTRKATKAH